MGTTPIGIDGVDLLELEIIHKQRLPPAIADLESAKSKVNSEATGIFKRSGTVGNYPDGPSAAWCDVAKELDSALSSGATNLEDTRVAVKKFLDDILRVDGDAQGRLDKARREMEGG